MRRFLFIATLLVILAPLGMAQGGNTTVTAIIRDPNGALYTNSQVNITFFDPGTPGKQPLLNGSVFQTTYTIFATDSFGRFTQSVADNGIIDSSSGTVNTQWSFRVVYSDRATSFVYRTPINCAANIPATCTAGVMDISAQLQAVAALLPAQPGGGGSFVVRGPPCASTMNFQMAGTFPTTANTAFNVNLNCNVTSTSITQAGGGGIQTGAIAQFTLIQDAIGGRSFSWPSNFIDQPPIQVAALQTTNASFWYDGTNWHAQTFPASGGGGGVNPAGVLGDVQANNGAGGLKIAKINDDGTTVTITEPTTLSNGGTLNGSFAGTPTFGPLGNESLKPISGTAIRYVTPFGNNSNDGLSWGTAKLTIYAALQSLPGGLSSPPTAGKGTVYVADGGGACGGLASDGVTLNSVQAGSVNPYSSSGTGIWIMAPSDPNYASPPTGWLRFSGPFSVIGGSGTCNAAQARQALLTDIAAGAIGSFSASTKPAVWISGVQGSIRFENIAFESAWNGIRLGIDSNGNRTAVGAQGVTFRNVAATTSTFFGASPGPTVDIGANVFWIWFEGCTFSPNINASVSSDQRANIVINRGGGSGAGGLITVRDNVWNGGGGIKYYTAGSVNSLMVDNLTIEGSLGHGQPAIWLPGAGAQSANAEVTANFVFLADYVDVVPGVLVEGQLSPSTVKVSNVEGQGISVQGPATVVGLGGVQNTSTTTLSPALSMQAGFFSSSFNMARVYGQQDTLRRSFAPVDTRFVNKAPQLPASWTAQSGSPTITGGIAAPDGTSNAGQISAAGAATINFFSSSLTTIAGDWVIAGVWARSQTSNGASGSAVGQLLGTSWTSISLSGGDAGTTNINLPSFIKGDGEWGWYPVAFKVTGVNAGTGTVSFRGVGIDATHTLQYYAPILLYIPSGTVSDNEASEIAMHLVSYPETSIAGDVSMLRGHTLHFNGSNFLVDNGSNGTFANGAQLRFLSPNGTNYTSIQGPSSNPGANVNLVLPSANSSGVQCFNNDGSGNISYSNCSGGTGTPGGADTQVQFNSTGTFGGSPNLTWISPALTVGLNATATGQVKYKGVTSGTVTTQSQDAAGTWTFKWPATAGTSGFPMVTDGTGVASWSLLGLAGGGTNSGSAAFTNTQLVGVSGGALASLTGTLTGTNPVLTLTSALTTSVPFALNTPSSPTADIFDLSINGSKTSWVDNLGIWHAPSYTATGSGALALSGTEGTCPSPSAGIDILCIGNLGTHTIQSSLNGANFKDNAQFSNSGPAAHGVCLVGSIFPQLNCTTAGTVGQAFVSGGAGADGFFGILGAVGGGTGNTTNTLHGVGMGEGTAALNFSAAGTAGQAFISGGAGADGSYGTFDLSLGTNTLNNLPINRGGTGAATLAAANIATVTGAITPNNCVKWSSATVITDSGGVCGGAGGSARLDQLLGGTATNTINSTIFPQVWNWALTGSTTAFKFGENTAATGASNILLQASTLNTSTAVPFQTDSNGNGYQLNSSGLFKPIGTGAIATPGAANNLVVSRGSSTAVSYIPPVAAGKVLIDNGPGVDPSFQDPIISQAFVNLWTTQDVTTTRTSAAVRNPIFSQTGTLQLTWASITGSPATCTLQIQGVDSVGNALNNGSTFSVSPANGITSQTFTAAAALQSAAQIKAIFACGVYPSTGTLTLDFTPIPNVNVINTVAISAASLPLPTGASTSAKQPALGTAGAASADVITVQGIASMTKLLVTPDSVALPANQSVNVNQVGGTAIDTNSGNKSAGTQRVVLATDQPNLTTPLNINKAQINGVTPLMGNGVTGTGSQRVTVASDNTPFETVPVTTATTTDTTLRCTLVSAASTNATNCKASAGNIYGYRFVNTTTTIYYLRMYNLTTSPTCSSATGFIESIPIPPAGAAGQAGGIVSMQPFGEGYGTGIAFCFTGGSSSTDNTNAAVGVFGTILYK